MGVLGLWAAANGVTLDEARRRFAQYVVLCAIASVAALRRHLVFKGGNALEFVWQPNRSTIDLDFSIDQSGDDFEIAAAPIGSLLTRGLHQVGPRFGLALAVHSVRQNPPGEDKTFATYVAKVGYALPDEPRLLLRMANGEPSTHIIPVEMSVNEPICATAEIAIDPAFPNLRVSTLEDIVAEKLRALLQQPIRDRERRQDLLDIAVIVQRHSDLDTDRVATFLLAKAAARDVPVSRAAFRAPAIAERAGVGYEALAATTRILFVPFDQAMALLFTFVDDLPLPD
jgi:hypothetical protein